MFRSQFCALAMIAFVAILSATIGCGGGDQDIPLSVQSGGANDQGASAPSNTSSQAATGQPTAGAARPPIPAGHVLVGNWKGDLIATAEQLKEMNCQSVTLELEFGANGEMAMLATMTNASGQEESAGIANWSIAKEEGNRYTIQSQESDNEIQELVVEMLSQNTMVVNAAEGGQFKLTRFEPPPMPPAPQPGAPAASQAQRPGTLTPPPVSNQLPQTPNGQVQPPPVR